MPDPNTADPEPAPGDLDELWTRLLPESDAARTLPAEEHAELDSKRVLLGYAPTALVDGAWLVPWLGVRESNTELGAALLDAFALEVGHGDSALHHGNLYRASLVLAGIAVEEPASVGFARDSRLDAADFELSLVGLEAPGLGFVLGVHAFVCRRGLPEAVARELEPLGTAFGAAHQPGSELGARAEALARRCLSAYARLPAADWPSVWRGAQALARARRRWTESLTVPRTSSPEQAMLALVRLKAGHAHGYHARVALAGGSLDAALDPGVLDAPALLAELARSRYVVAGDPERSPLVAATRFGGTMLGVFSEAELAVIRRWIASLADPRATVTGTPARSLALDVRPAAAQEVAVATPEHRARRTSGLRELYRELLSPETTTVPASRAVEHARRLLGRRSVRGLTRAGLWPYSADRLWAFIDNRHRAQVSGGKPSPLLDRAIDVLDKHDVLWLLTQLAPAAFVDGAWLSGLLSPARLTSASAGFLFRIYRDELGAGSPAAHHGNVLRGALSGAGVELPATGSQEFVESPAFLDAAFVMPVFWLSLARASGALWPELLGLNLAVEIAGLGSGYERAISLLRKHGIDPYFFELHNAIDNPSSGHSAWAGRAISLYMDELVARGDPRAVGDGWQRVWSGFASYDRAARPLLQRIALRLAPGLLLGVLRPSART